MVRELPVAELRRMPLLVKVPPLTLAVMELLETKVTFAPREILAEVVFKETGPPLALRVVAPPEEIKERF